MDQNGLSATGARRYGIAPACLIVVALLIAGIATFGEHFSTSAQAPGTRAAAPPAEAWVRTELFFGLTDRDGHPVSIRSWQHFADATLTPAFPDGFTLVEAEGRWSDRSHATHKEATEIFTVLYPASDTATMNRSIEQVSRDYVDQFHQKSVLRADSGATVRSYGP